VALALAAWSVYIGDRLLDARHARSPLRERHHFHWRRRKVLLPIALGAAVAAVAIVLYCMPLAARERNSVLAAAALAYFASVHSPWRVPAAKIGLRIPKELLVGILFTLACATPVWARMAGHRLHLLMPTVCFIALAWLNCHAIESWESAKDSARVSVVRLATALGSAALLCGAVAAAAHDLRQAALLAGAAVSGALLGWLDLRRRTLPPVALRAAADLALLVPMALLAIR
jgi:hypothetical protein